MKIAIAQMSTRAGDFERTVERMVDYARRAADAGADLVVFPSPALCGTTPVAFGDREGFLLDLAESLTRLSEEAACPCLVPVLSDIEGAPMSEALLLSEGDVVPVRLSAYLESMAGSEASDDEDAAASPLPELEFAGARLGIAFTYEDLDDYDDYDYDVDVIVFLSSYGFATDDVSSALGTSLAEGRFPVDAETTGAWIVGVGPVGCYGDQVFCGSSFVLSPWGELAAQAPGLEEALLVCDVDPSSEGPLESPLTPEVYDAPLTTWGALTLGLRETVVRQGCSDVCVLVDPDLGSLLVATLAVDALGPTHVHALVLQTGEREADEATAELVRNLRLSEHNVERADARGESDPTLARDLAEVRLAALARHSGALALGSWDKTALALEAPVGVGAARLMPLGDLYRSDVVALAHLRNTISPVIPAQADVSLPAEGLAGLDELASAETRLMFVDLVLSSYLEWEQSLSDIVSEHGHAALVASVLERLHAVEPLRADCGMQIALSSKTLAEARGPQGLAWRDRPRKDSERLDEKAFSTLVQEDANDEDDDESAASAAYRREKDVHDLLGYLRDFSLGGGLSSSGAPGEGGGRHGSSGGSSQPFWQGPFSEN